MPYYVQVIIDGQQALHLTRTNFKQDGQMQAFIDAMEALTK